jgi:hypothetical protein
MTEEIENFMDNSFSELLESQGLTDTRADELGKAVAPTGWTGASFGEQEVYQAVSKCDLMNLRWLEKYYYGLLLVAHDYARKKGYQSPLDTLIHDKKYIGKF